MSSVASVALSICHTGYVLPAEKFSLDQHEFLRCSGLVKAGFMPVWLIDQNNSAVCICKLTIKQLGLPGEYS